MEENDAKTIAWDPSFIKEYMKTIPGRLKLAAIVSIAQFIILKMISLRN